MMNKRGEGKKENFRNNSTRANQAKEKRKKVEGGGKKLD